MAPRPSCVDYLNCCLSPSVHCCHKNWPDVEPWTVRSLSVAHIMISLSTRLLGSLLGCATRVSRKALVGGEVR